LGRRAAGSHERIEWNPLRNNGDAFVLAVHLGRLLSAPDRTDTHAAANNVFESCGSGMDRDIFAATRCAIVRAAALIGAQMP